MKKMILSVLAVLLFASTECFALPSYSPTDLAALADAEVNSLVQTAAIGSTYKPLEPATPLGLLIGFEFGVDVSAVSLPADFQNALATATNGSAGSIPAYFPLPRLSVHKGLPFGIDVGFGGAQFQNKYKDYGGDIKWAFLPNRVFGSLAIRQTMNYSNLYFMSSHSFDTQLLYSRNLLVVDPYVGIGQLFWNGDIEGVGLPAGVSGHRSGNNTHFFVGVPVKLLVLRVTAEYDYNTAGIHSFGARIGFGL